MRRSLVLRFVILSAAVLVGVAAFQGSTPGEGLPAGVAADKNEEKPKNPDKTALAKFMRAKLPAASQVLEGLCTEDYDLIAAGARKLQTASRAEQWRVSNDAIYLQHSVEFQSDVAKLLKAAEEKQIDAAGLAWTKTTLNCIECHRWVRARLIADAP